MGPQQTIILKVPQQTYGWRSLRSRQRFSVADGRTPHSREVYRRRRPQKDWKRHRLNEETPSVCVYSLFYVRCKISPQLLSCIDSRNAMSWWRLPPVDVYVRGYHASCMLGHQHVAKVDLLCFTATHVVAMKVAAYRGVQAAR